MSVVQGMLHYFDTQGKQTLVTPKTLDITTKKKSTFDMVGSNQELSALTIRPPIF